MFTSDVTQSAGAGWASSLNRCSELATKGVKIGGGLWFATASVVSGVGLMLPAMACDILLTDLDKNTYPFTESLLKMSAVGVSEGLAYVDRSYNS